MYVPTPIVHNRWETDWTRRWFYHTSSADDGLWSSGGVIQLNTALKIVLTSREDALLHLLLDVTKQLSMRDLVEECCVFGVWPLAKGWSVELGAPKLELPTLFVMGCEGTRRKGTDLGPSQCFFSLFFCTCGY